MQGKGSKNRTKKFKTYRENYDKIFNKENKKDANRKSKTDK
jgi:hypothetical protein